MPSQEEQRKREKERARERERESREHRGVKEGNIELWGMLRRVKWSLLWLSQAHALTYIMPRWTKDHLHTHTHTHTHTHARTHTHTHTHTHFPPLLPEVLIWHSIYTHLHSLLPPLWSWQVLKRYITPRSLSLRAAGPDRPFTAALSQSSFSNGLGKKQQQWALVTRPASWRSNTKHQGMFPNGLYEERGKKLSVRRGEVQFQSRGTSILPTCQFQETREGLGFDCTVSEINNTRWFTLRSSCS